MSTCQHDCVFEVKAGPHVRTNAVVSTPLLCEVHCQGSPGSHTLIDQASGEELAAQCSEGEMTFIIPQMQAEEVREYKIGPAWEGDEGVAIVRKEGQFDFLVGGELFTSYVVKEGIARPYCYPVYGPGGVQMTNFAPGDHVHHTSLYVAHGSVNGHNNWDEGEGHACTVNRRCEIVSQGPVYGELLAVSDWVTQDGEKLLAEETRWRVYNLPDIARFVDVTTTWIAAYQGVTLGDTKEAGTISVRLAESMEVPNGGTIVNAYGATGEEECWGKRAPWVDYCGPVEDQTVGIAIFDHPNNFRHPTWWHVRDYGLFTANCWGLHDYYGDWSIRGDHSMPQGDMLQFNFRLYLHAGDAEAAQVGARYLDYAFPPQVAQAE